MSVGGTNIESGQQASLEIQNEGFNAPLTKMMLEMSIKPGSSPSYELCKTIYAYHPLGHKMTSGPITVAQSQKRTLSIAGAPEEELVKAFEKSWASLGEIGGDALVHNVMTLSRVYGIATLMVGALDKGGEKYPANKPLPMDKLHKMTLYFNTLDSLNTAGSLVLNQDPQAPDFMKPKQVSIGSEVYHLSRTCTLMNEQPIWIEWSNSAFGFVGRSVYQRALYPMAAYLQSMISDYSIQEKLMVLVYKMVSPGSVLDKIARAFGAFKRQIIKYSKTGNVVSIGKEEELSSLDLMHTKDAGEYSRKNILDNIATAAGMPAVMLNQETLAEGFGEGTEDAKIIAKYIDRIRIEMNSIYRFLDDIVMRLAWNPEFYMTIQAKYPNTYGNVSYEAAFYEWKNAFEATWPNLLTEPDSEKSKKSEARFKTVIALCESLMPILDPDNKASLVAWIQDQINQDDFLFDGELNLDFEALSQYVPPVPTMGAGAEKEPSEPRPFSMSS
ncbi:phage portal protein [Ferrovum sp.]|jgi:hypothetical protein|uniref:anti-CBASS protein Acb1 family protein n=1 Tax=Ferrovum sp. TaxID=2609467 RepID=UPI00261D1E8E|nr:anti-CBASS Acb1 family protein [Ferrovum sp.]